MSSMSNMDVGRSREVSQETKNAQNKLAEQTGDSKTRKTSTPASQKSSDILSNQQAKTEPKSLLGRFRRKFTGEGAPMLRSTGSAPNITRTRSGTPQQADSQNGSRDSAELFANQVPASTRDSKGSIHDYGDEIPIPAEARITFSSDFVKKSAELTAKSDALIAARANEMATKQLGTARKDSANLNQTIQSVADSTLASAAVTAQRLLEATKRKLPRPPPNPKDIDDLSGTRAYSSVPATGTTGQSFTPPTASTNKPRSAFDGKLPGGYTHVQMPDTPPSAEAPPPATYQWLERRSFTRLSGSEATTKAGSSPSLLSRVSNASMDALDLPFFRQSYDTKNAF